ncbi:hypothetical protein TGARI_215430A, partial [Toxoplasma gondii ARI]
MQLTWKQILLIA